MSESRPLATMQYGEFSRRAYDRAVQQDRIIKAQLELTYRCNLHCRHCYTDPYNDKDLFPRELTLAEIHRLLDEMHDLGVIWLNLSGGDIFMHPDFSTSTNERIGRDSCSSSIPTAPSSPGRPSSGYRPCLRLPSTSLATR